MKNNKNIILIGMMGVGKTAVSRMLAEQLNFDFLDTDSDLEEVTGMKLGDVLNKYGKVRYLSEESLISKKLIGRENTVIATGGTMLQDADNMQIFSDLGFVVWLDASAETIYKRVKRKGNLPLLAQGAKGVNLETVRKIISDRMPTYEAAADFKIEVDRYELDQVVAKIKRQYFLKEE